MLKSTKLTASVCAVLLWAGCVSAQVKKQDADLTATTVPDEVAQRCVDLAASLSLPFVGIDLRETPSGDFVCFEVNPMPGYSYFESNTGQPISEALVRLLAGKTEPVADVAGQRR